MLGIVTGIICLAIARLPESFVTQLQQDRPFNSSQSGWAFRLLVIAAVAQALYGGFFVLRTDRIQRARREDPKMAGVSKPDLVASLARGAAGIAALTLVYGIADLWITGERGGFWTFPLLLVAQAAWYYRLVRDIEKWLVLQPDAFEEMPVDGKWGQGPPDYTPPIARGLETADPGASG